MARLLGQILARWRLPTLRRLRPWIAPLTLALWVLAAVLLTPMYRDWQRVRAHQELTLMGFEVTEAEGNLAVSIDARQPGIDSRRAGRALAQVGPVVSFVVTFADYESYRIRKDAWDYVARQAGATYYGPHTQDPSANRLVRAAEPWQPTPSLVVTDLELLRGLTQLRRLDLFFGRTEAKWRWTRCRPWRHSRPCPSVTSSHRSSGLSGSIT